MGLELLPLFNHGVGGPKPANPTPPKSFPFLVERGKYLDIILIQTDEAQSSS